MKSYTAHNEDDTYIVRQDGSNDFVCGCGDRQQWASKIAATLNWREIWEANGGDVMELLQQHQEHQEQAGNVYEQFPLIDTEGQA